MPKRPTSLPSTLGPVEVRYVDKIINDNGKVENAMGFVSFKDRVIQILNNMNQIAESHTLRHEWVHLVLWDSGADNLLTEKQAEVICDALATALISTPFPK